MFYKSSVTLVFHTKTKLSICSKGDMSYTALEAPEKPRSVSNLLKIFEKSMSIAK